MCILIADDEEERDELSIKRMKLVQDIKEIDLAIAKIDMMKNVSHCKKQLDIIKKQQEKAQKEVDDAMANLKEHNESVEIAEINLQGATDGYNSLHSCFNA